MEELRLEDKAISANNALLIIRKNNAVHMIDVETNYILDSYGEYKTLDEAIDKAQAILLDEEVEYGITFRDK